MKNNKKCKNKYKQILIAVFSVIIICVVVLGAGYMYIRANIYKKTEPLTSEHLQAPVKTKEETIEYTEVEGITNVLLVGVDGIDFDEKYQRSDSMIIATLDSNKEKVKLTSLYRDTLVYIPGYGEEKMNLAFSLGGPELVMETIKYNFDVNIEKYIMINFAGFEAIIDQIGGVEIDVKEYQLHELNKYIGQATGGGDCPVEKAGLQILNGKQALSYARIRKGVGDDYERTERQREVLFKVVEKLQKTDVIKYFSIANKMLDYLRTNIGIMDGLNMAYTISKFSNLETEQLSIPVQELCVDEEVNGNMALRMDRYENALILNDFILNRSTEKNQSIYYEYEGFGE